MRLHGFGAAVTQQLFKEKTRMETDPLPSMALIMYRHLGPHNLQRGKAPIGTEFTEEQLKNHKGYPPTVIVSIEKLALCYLGEPCSETKLNQ